MYHMVVWIGDVHGGSKTAICPPTPVVLDNGATYIGSRLQAWIWREYVKHLENVARLRDKYQPATVTLGLNGDLTQGAKYTDGVIDVNESIHCRIAIQVLQKAWDVVGGFDAVLATRGTPSHVGKNASLEEGIMRVMESDKEWPVIHDPDTGQRTAYWHRYEVGGFLIDQRHHGRAGMRAHTRASYARLYAQDIELEHRLDEERPPDIAVRSHKHTYADSGRAHRFKTRLISLPCLQAWTEFGFKISIEKMPDLGICCAVLDEQDPHDRIYPFLHELERPEVTKIGGDE